MPLASEEAVAKAYNACAKEYDEVMIAEVKTPSYEQQLAQFTDAVAQVMCDRPAPDMERGRSSWWVLDMACGSGNMLEIVDAKLSQHTGDDTQRQATATAEQMAQEQGARKPRLLGIDVSAEMVAIAKTRLEPVGHDAQQGTMLSLPTIDDGTCAGMICYFALHHLDETQVKAAFCEWARVLAPGAPLLLGYWVGDGKPYFEEGLQVDIVNHRSDVIDKLLLDAGFAIDPENVTQQEFESMGLSAHYTMATRKAGQ
ncbi:hypothetical protein PTSG_10918 [Salpingoeca rosetta]|uniref:Methyltransferase domain-containing protein n=1 Tax=Salpingoeca rosetta (strain ATCC 50818 / BSB-021) TaxID=946362 RepID=F2URD9_SALR5|nr:uncharacterized protein PTSG_10918 [Salpingoeca rosetta]EGD80242.1 hypothetical protein PTSG_10918 [Salpingoeca rosetta]|eukprot:XP_004988304.1 hypothetical protein PTSG_10918 [Salpingoeca rosetta]